MMDPTRARRAVSVGVAAMAASAMLAVPVVVAAQEPSEFRTTVEGLGGYTGTGEGAPLSIQFYDLTGGTLPVNPGESEIEVTESFSKTILGTGPQSRAVASSMWPGGAFGDGFATICDCGEDYFIKADARYPEGPFEDDQSVPEARSGMLARAFGLDVFAQASNTNSPNANGAGFGNSASETTSTVNEEGVVVTTADASISDLNIGGGLITIDSVRTILTATSDGTTAATEGTTTVSGLSFMGVPFRFTEDGLEAGGEDGGVPPPDDVVTPDELGITIELVDHEETVDGASGERVAGGLIITLPTRSMAAGLAELEEQSGFELPVDPLSPPQTGLDEDLDRELANAYVRALFPFLTSSPTITYTIGRASVEAAASLPFQMPDFGSPSFDPPPTTTTPPSTGGSVGPPSFGGTATPPMQPDQPTQVAPPAATGEQTLAGAPPLPDWFDGLPLVLFLLGAMVTGIGGYGLRGLTGAALGTGSSEFCDTGAPKRVPELRTG